MTQAQVADHGQRPRGRGTGQHDVHARRQGPRVPADSPPMDRRARGREERGSVGRRERSRVEGGVPTAPSADPVGG